MIYILSAMNETTGTPYIQEDYRTYETMINLMEDIPPDSENRNTYKITAEADVIALIQADNRYPKVQI